jgi:hypothetical protein
LDQYFSGPEWYDSLNEKVKELEKLPPDWDSYGAPPPDKDTSRFAVDSLLKIVPINCPPPQVVPLSDGGIAFEWHDKGIDLEIRAHPTRKLSYLYASDSNEEEGCFDANRVSKLLSHLV